MLVFDSVRYAWRRFQAWLHGHEHVDPMEMSSYGARTAFGVGMIHGVGAETGTQVLLIAAIGGASSQGLGIPMMLAFIVGLLISNSIVVLITATGFIASRVRERLYVVIGVVAGTFSLVIGTIFLFGLDAQLPSIEAWLFGGGDLGACRCCDRPTAGPRSPHASGRVVCAGRRSGACCWTSSPASTTTSPARSWSRAVVPSTPRRRRPRSTGRSTSSRSWASSATATGRVGARSSTWARSTDHAHLVCGSCGRRLELARHEVQPLADDVLLRHGFEVDIEHLTIEGRCADCRAAG